MNRQSKRYAVVDLEATGTGSRASIIQVGIVIIEDGEIVATYATDVNPHEPLDDHISQLTGLTDAQLAQAPTFAQVAGEIYQLVSDCIFVAHNVHFDANLLAEQLFMEGYELRSDRIDTVELAQVFFPTLEKYGLEALSHSLGLPLEAAHTAISDALATAHLFLQLQAKIASLPRQTLLTLVGLADSLLYETGQVIVDALDRAEQAREETYINLAGLLIKPPTESQLTPKTLAPDFKQNLQQLGLSPKPQQETFAQLVGNQLTEQGATFIEGRAGLGKTYAYLLSLLAQDDPRQILVTVPTKMLQNQILEQEGQRLADTFGISFASLKSPRHYLSLDKFKTSLSQPDSNRLISRYKMQLLVWLLETETGDLDEIKQKQRLATYFDSIRHDGHLKPDSPFAGYDFWQRLELASQQSRVLVTNHAYLLSHFPKNPHFLDHKILVIDEAQRFFLTMEEAARRQVNVSQLLLDLRQLARETTDELEARVLTSIQQLLGRWVTDYRRQKEADLSAEQVALLKQELALLEQTDLSELGSLLEPPFSDFWLETQYDKEQRQVFLRAASMDFWQLQNQLPETTKAYLISATLKISKRVKLPELLGLADYSSHRLPQPPSNRQEIWLDTSMTSEPHLPDVLYVQELVWRLQQLAEQHKPILVLLTARESLLTLSDLLDDHQMPHLAQDKHGTAQQIKKRFDRGDRQILLGMGTFWEGVDFAQQDDLILVIPKLPFDNPKDRFIKKLHQKLKLEGKNPFYDYSLPVAGLRLKQALGRVKRQSHQRSAVILLDKRLWSKTYGKTLLNSLSQEGEIHQEKFPQILSQVQEFWYNKGMTTKEED